jgi:hypothetical protein
MKSKAKTFGLSFVIGMVVYFCSGADAHAVFPENIWDLHVNGVTAGVAHLDFATDKTLTGYFAIRPARKSSSVSINYGYFPVKGEWDYETPSKVVGFFSGGSDEVPFDVSFSATGKTNKIKIKAISNSGPMTLQGKVAIPLNDFDLTSWSAEVFKDGVRFTELYDLSRRLTDCVRLDKTDPENPTCPGSEVIATPLNLYAFQTEDSGGGGPGYELTGRVLLSWGNQIGVVVEELQIDKDTGEVANDGDVRAATGVLKAHGTKSSMQAADRDHHKVRMTITEVPVP